MRMISVYCLAVVFLIASVVLAGNVQKDQAVDAKALFEKKCIACHDIDRPTSKKKTASEWTSTVERMRISKSPALPSGASQQTPGGVMLLRYLRFHMDAMG